MEELEEKAAVIKGDYCSIEAETARGDVQHIRISSRLFNVSLCDTVVCNRLRAGCRKHLLRTTPTGRSGERVRYRPFIRWHCHYHYSDLLCVGTADTGTAWRSVESTPANPRSDAIIRVSSDCGWHRPHQHSVAHRLGCGWTARRSHADARGVRSDFSCPSRARTYSRLGDKRSGYWYSACPNRRWRIDRSSRLAFGLSRLCGVDARHGWRLVPGAAELCTRKERHYPIHSCFVRCSPCSCKNGSYASAPY